MGIKYKNQKGDKLKLETQNLSTLKIHKLSQEQYLRELEAGNIDEYALYLTPSDNGSYKQDKLVGVQGQVVGFDENGNAIAQNMPKVEVDNTLSIEGAAADAKAVGDALATITIDPMIGSTSTAAGTSGLVPAPAAGSQDKFLKGDGTWGTLAPQKIALVATAGQTSFTIPFEYDSLSNNLTVYFNGILMKETDNYTVNTSNNTVNLVDFSAESGDIITIMGLLGAQSIDFGQEAIDAINRINIAVEDAINRINNTVSDAKTEIDTKVTTAFEQIDTKIDEVEAFVEQLPDDVSKLMSKNTNNTLDSGYKITLTNVTPSADGDVTTKQYVDNAISTATSNIVTDVFHRGTSAPSNTKLLWIDTNSGNGNGLMKYHNGSSWVAISAVWS